jgi:glyoxylate reductase
MASKRVLVLSPLTAELINAMLQANADGGDIGTVEVTTYQGGGRDELLEAVGQAEIIIGDYTFHNEMDQEVIKAASSCILIQQLSVGYQHIDVEEAARQGIPVANVAGANSIGVAEHTIMVTLACLKKLMLQYAKTMSGQWAQDEMANYGVFELFGKTIGIVGMGRIGREVAIRAKAFGCNVIYSDANRLAEPDEQELGVTFRTLEGLLAEADVVTLHVPLTPETELLINEERISLMKQTAVLVNVARGEVIDENAVAAALAEGRLGGAGIDVFSVEPVTQDNPLLHSPNTIVTPHTAGATNESRMRIIMSAMANVVSVLKGQTPENIVNGVEPRLE